MKGSKKSRLFSTNLNEIADAVEHKLFVERFRAEEESLNYNNLFYGQVTLKKSRVMTSLEVDFSKHEGSNG